MTLNRFSKGVGLVSSGAVAYLNIYSSTELSHNQIFTALCKVGLEKEYFEITEFLNY